MENKKIGAGVGVMILRDGKILLGRRHHDPGKADSDLGGEGTWTMPGGKIEFGEGFEEAAIREVKEETDIDVKKEDLKLISLANDLAVDAHFITVGFLCEKFNGEAKTMEPDEIVEWRWYNLDNLPTKIFLPSQKVLANYHSGKIY